MDNNRWDTFRSYENEDSNNQTYAAPTSENSEYRYVNSEYIESNMKPKTNKKIIKGIALLLSVALVAFGGGFGGYYLASQTISKNSNSSNGQVVIQESTNNNAGVSNASSTNDLTALINSVKDSVVEITTETVQYGTWTGQYVSTGAGSGIVVSENGYILTCNHVIDGATKIVVTLSDDSEYQAKVVGTDSNDDLAVIKIEAEALTAVTFGDSDSLQVGDYVVAIGNPLGQLGGTVTDGIISALSREISINDQTMTLLQTNAAVNPGNSGGALFNSNGELVGVVNAKASSSEIEGIGFAIPSSLAKEVMTNLIENGSINTVRLGITVINITNASTAAKYHVDNLGCYIQAVETNSNAEIAGLKVGDYIKSFNGVEIDNSDTLNKEVRKCKLNDQAEMIVIRNGTEYRLSVVFYNAE